MFMDNTNQKAVDIVLYLLSIILLGVLLAACGTTASKHKKRADNPPGWVTGESNEYPPEFYLIGVGQGGSLLAAGNQARSELAKILRVTVESSLYTSKVVTQHTSKRRREEEIAQHMQQQIRTTTHVELKGITIAANWIDSLSRQYYSLAILDRNKAAIGLRKDIEVLDTEVQALVVRAGSGDDLLQRIGLIIRAKRHQRERTEINQYLRVIGKGGHGKSAEIGAGTLDEQVKQLQQSLVIGVNVQGAHADKIADFAHGGLAGAGFKTIHGSSAGMVLKVILDLNQPSLIDEWYWVRGSLNVSLADVADGTVRGSHVWSIRQSSQDPDIATQRAVTQIKKIFNQELGDVILGFANLEE